MPEYRFPTIRIKGICTSGKHTLVGSAENVVDEVPSPLVVTTSAKRGSSSDASRLAENLSEFVFPEISLAGKDLCVPDPPRTKNGRLGLFQGRTPPKIPLIVNTGKVEMLDLPGTVETEDYYDPENLGTRGRVYYKVGLSHSNGLVLMCHGKVGDKPESEMHQKCFNILGRTLALAGYVAISIYHVSTNGSDTASNEFIANILYFMENFGGWFDLQGKPLVLIGHSEGGKGAFKAAYRISKKMEVAPYFTKVRAIVGLAPAEGIGEDDEPWWIGVCDRVFFLQGTHDGDPNTCRAGSLALYNVIDVPQKYFMWTHGCRHQNFIEHLFEAHESDGDLCSGNLNYDINTIVHKGAQLLITSHYVAMFIMHHVGGGGAQYGGLFKGDKVIEWDPSKIDISVYTELVQRFRAFPRYDYNYAWSPMSAAPGLQTHSDFVSVSSYDKLSKTYVCNREAGLGWILKWDNLASQRDAVFNVPCHGETVKAASRFEFHAIQIARSLYNNQGTVPIVGKAVLIYGVNGDKISNEVSFRVEPSLSMNSISMAHFKTMSCSVLSVVSIWVGLFSISLTDRASIRVMRLIFPKSRGEIAIAKFRVMYQ